MLMQASNFNHPLDFDTAKVTIMRYVEGPPPPVPPPPVPPRTAYYNNDDTTPLTADEPSPVRWPSTTSRPATAARARGSSGGTPSLLGGWRWLAAHHGSTVHDGG